MNGGRGQSKGDVPMRKLIILCLCSFAALQIVTPSYAVAADANATKAKARVKKARALYEAGKFAEAIEEYKAAYAALPSPDIVYNMGLIYRVQGDRSKCIESFSEYLKQAPQGDHAEEARRSVAQLTREMVPVDLQPRYDQAKAEWEQYRAAHGDSFDERWKSLQSRIVEKKTEGLGIELDAFLMSVRAADAKPVAKKPVYKKAWFWVAVIGGAAVVGTGAALGAIYGQPKDPTPTLGVLR